MEVAIDINGKRTYIEDAVKGEQYFCPICNGEVIVKQGELNMWHFAHVSACEDKWGYDMSDWHRKWQERYPEENREVTVQIGKEKHRADILMGKYIIEFQHSRISINEFDERNTFYTNAGYKVIWVFDCAEIYEDGRLRMDNNCEDKFYWSNPSKVWTNILPQRSKNVAIIIELEGYFIDEDGEEEPPFLKKISWAKPDNNRSDYGLFYTDDNLIPDLSNEDSLEEILLNKWERFNKFLRSNAPYKEKCSRVKGHRKSWYLCEKNNDWHNSQCENCCYNLIREYRTSTLNRNGGMFFYCCYPRKVQELDECGDIHVPGIRM